MHRSTVRLNSVLNVIYRWSRSIRRVVTRIRISGCSSEKEVERGRSDDCSWRASRIDRIRIRLIYHCLVWPPSRALIATAANITFLELSRRLRRLYSPTLFDRRSSNHGSNSFSKFNHDGPPGDPSFLSLSGREGEDEGGGGKKKGKRKRDRKAKDVEGRIGGAIVEDGKKEGQGWKRNTNVWSKRRNICARGRWITKSGTG